MLDFTTDTIQFFEITSAVTGYGEKMVQSVMTALPEDWEACVVMDYSEGLWERMSVSSQRHGSRFPRCFSHQPFGS
jgi:hypothetical protein